jgi:hypothetical protein
MELRRRLTGGRGRQQAGTGTQRGYDHRGPAIVRRCSGWSQVKTWDLPTARSVATPWPKRPTAWVSVHRRSWCQSPSSRSHQSDLSHPGRAWPNRRGASDLCQRAGRLPGVPDRVLGHNERAHPRGLHARATLAVLDPADLDIDRLRPTVTFSKLAMARSHCSVGHLFPDATVPTCGGHWRVERLFGQHGVITDAAGNVPGRTTSRRWKAALKGRWRSPGRCRAGSSNRAKA